jgi:hypothetical protein
MHVTRGLDHGSIAFAKKQVGFFREVTDCRVKPGNNGSGPGNTWSRDRRSNFSISGP